MEFCVFTFGFLGPNLFDPVVFDVLDVLGFVVVVRLDLDVLDVLDVLNVLNVLNVLDVLDVLDVFVDVLDETPPWLGWYWLGWRLAFFFFFFFLVPSTGDVTGTNGDPFKGEQSFPSYCKTEEW